MSENMEPINRKCEIAESTFEKHATLSVRIQTSSLVLTCVQCLCLLQPDHLILSTIFQRMFGRLCSELK